MPTDAPRSTRNAPGAEKGRLLRLLAASVGVAAALFAGAFFAAATHPRPKVPRVVVHTVPIATLAAQARAGKVEALYTPKHHNALWATLRDGALERLGHVNGAELLVWSGSLDRLRSSVHDTLPPAIAAEHAALRRSQHSINAWRTAVMLAMGVLVLIIWARMLLLLVVG